MPYRKSILVALLASWGGTAHAAPPPFPQQQRADVAPSSTLTISLSFDEKHLAPPPAARELTSWRDVLDLVRAHGTDLRVAMADARAADGRSRAALGQLLPNVSASGQYSRNFITQQGVQFVGTLPNGAPNVQPYTAPTEDYLDGNVSLDQSIVSFESWKKLASANANGSAAHLSATDAKRAVSVAVASAILSVAAAQRAAEVNRDGCRAALERLALVEKRRALGGATDLDVVRAAQDAESARATQVAGDETLRKAREALGAAVGIADELAVDWGKLRVASAEDLGCHSLADLEKRADVAAAAERVRAADLAAEAQAWNLMPTLSARLTADYTTVDRGPVPRGSLAAMGIVSIPIYDGGARYGTLSALRAERDKAAEQRDKARREARQDVERARRAILVAEETRSGLASARRLAQENERLARVTFLSGHATSLEVTTAASALRQAELALALEDYEVERARLILDLTAATCDW